MRFGCAAAAGRGQAPYIWTLDTFRYLQRPVAHFCKVLCGHFVGKACTKAGDLLPSTAKNQTQRLSPEL